MSGTRGLPWVDSSSAAGLRLAASQHSSTFGCAGTSRSTVQACGSAEHCCWEQAPDQPGWPDAVPSVLPRARGQGLGCNTRRTHGGPWVQVVLQGIQDRGQCLWGDVPGTLHLLQAALTARRPAQLPGHLLAPTVRACTSRKHGLLDMHAIARGGGGAFSSRSVSKPDPEGRQHALLCMQGWCSRHARHCAAIPVCIPVLRGRLRLSGVPCML